MQYHPQGPAYITPTYHQPMQPMQPMMHPLQPLVSNQNTLNNTVVVTQAGANGGNPLLLIPSEKLQSRGWTSGMCQCLNDLNSCALTIFCPAIMMCRLANRLDECAFLMYCLPGGAMALRTKLRTMGGIKGSICSDCIMTTCCVCCTMCQMAREMNKMGL